MLLLDTNVIIYYFKGEAAVAAQIQEWRKNQEIFAISVMTKIELLSYTNISPNEIRKINTFLKEYRIIILDETIAEKAAEIRRKHKAFLADAIIAATAIVNNIPLATRNLKHFRKIKELKMAAV